MPTQAEIIDDLQQTQNDLQSQIDTIQDKVAAKLAADKQTILDLQAVIDSGDSTNNAALQAIADGLKSSIADLAATPTD